MMTEPPVTLRQIAAAVGGRLTGEAALPLKDVTHDSRRAGPGTLFVAVRGASFDGNDYVEQAARGGAAAVISERPPHAELPWIQVTDARRALALAAAEVHHHPSRALPLVGVTGTNGKTTTCYLVAGVAAAAGEPYALLGTVETRIGARRVKSERTTGEASETQRLLREAVEAGCRLGVMECSSHAIDLHRCDALSLRVAVFTNLTPDHLDYHRTMEAYFASKRRLFDGSLGERPQVSVINADDAWGAGLARDLRAEGASVLTFGLEKPAEISAGAIEISFAGTRFTLRTPAGEREINSPLVGRPHVSNLLAAAASALSLGFNLDLLVEAFRTCAGAPGRFERVPADAGFVVVVDYAHTDDALANVLRTARNIARGRVITVFGCGGDRDRTKRAPMGETAASLSDYVILTSDNPRTEDPLAILADVEVGLQRVARPYLKIADRREAIHRAISEAEDGDLVIIAGKGHEDYQIIGERVIHFDDREVAREALDARRAG